MSEGRFNRHTLAPIHNMPDKQMRTELERWANDLPIGLIGFIVNRSTDWTINTGVFRTFSWTTTEYQSDHFFNYDSTPEATTIIIPKNLGGLYGFQFNVKNNSGADFSFYWRASWTDVRTGSGLAVCRGQEPTFQNNQSLTFGGILPVICSPGDAFTFGFRHEYGSDRTLTAVTPSSTEPKSIRLTFYRLFPADVPTQ